MIPIERLEKLNNKILAWSAYKSLKGENSDSKKLDSFIRELDKIIKELNAT